MQQLLLGQAVLGLGWRQALWRDRRDHERQRSRAWAAIISWHCMCACLSVMDTHGLGWRCGWCSGAAVFACSSMFACVAAAKGRFVHHPSAAHAATNSRHCPLAAINNCPCPCPAVSCRPGRCNLYALDPVSSGLQPPVPCWPAIANSAPWPSHLAFPTISPVPSKPPETS